MKRKIADTQAVLNFISVGVLLVGLSISVFIYLTAQNPPENTLSEFEGSKRYIHDLELFGGTLNVIMSQFIQWFEGLWHGKTLAFSVAVISIFISFCFFFAGQLSDPNLNSDDRDENNRDGTT